MEHTPLDSRTHHQVLTSIVSRGFAPEIEELASLLECSLEDVKESFERLQSNHGLVLHPDGASVWIAHPFSLSPTAVWVQGEHRGWWAPCLWCALGIVELIGGSGQIQTRLGGETQEISIRVRSGRVAEEHLSVHFSLPPARAWDNVIHYCATVLPFESEEEIDSWCQRHQLPRGAAVPIQQVADLAAAWYGRHLDPAWKKWTAQEASELFRAAGLRDSFWSIATDTSRF